jgi:hypothetical protein
LTAVRSWLGLGASVVIFADNVTEIDELPGTLTAEGVEDKERLRVFASPLPRSLLGAPRLDLIMEAGELHATTHWVCMINADIVLPKRFGSLTKGPLRRKDFLAVGERLNCRPNPEVGALPKSVNSFEDLEHWSMAPCWPHGSGGKDYFLYRKGYFRRRGLVIPPFWIGKFVWDHWLLNATHASAVDLTPALLVGHFSHEYDWNWRAMRRKPAVQVAAAKTTALRDIQHNNDVSRCNGAAIFVCMPHQSTHDARYQLCPGGEIQLTPRRAVQLYGDGISAVRLAIKPKGQEGTSRRVYQSHALTGSSPSFWTNEILSWAKSHGCPG